MIWAHKTAWAWIGAILVAVGVMGCATGETSATALYTLPVNGTGAVTPAARNAVGTVVIGDIELPRHLDSGGIVMQLSDVEVQQARTHLWAGPLDRQLERALQQHLGRMLSRAKVVEDRSRPLDAEALSVEVDLDAFQGRYDGRAVISGTWQVRKKNGEVLSRQSFDIEQDLVGDGYPALVKTLGMGWAEVAARMAADLGQLRSGEPR